MIYDLGISIMDKHRFWNTQPVPKIGTEIETTGIIYDRIIEAFAKSVDLPEVFHDFLTDTPKR